MLACDDDDKKDDPKTTPTVTDVTPTTVAVGDEITITGTDLDQATAVAFGLNEANFMLVAKANFVSVSSTSIKVKIPTGVIFPSGLAVIAGETTIPWADGVLTSKTASKAQADAVAFLLCANNAYNTFPDETSLEYQQAIGGCLANNLDITGLSFGEDTKPNNDYTNELFIAIAEMVTYNYTGQPAEVIEASIAGIQYMILSFYQSLQSAQK
jgi:hypothetical protein